MRETGGEPCQRHTEHAAFAEVDPHAVGAVDLPGTEAVVAGQRHLRGEPRSGFTQTHRT